MIHWDLHTSLMYQMLQSKPGPWPAGTSRGCKGADGRWECRAGARGRAGCAPQSGHRMDTMRKWALSWTQLVYWTNLLRNPSSLSYYSSAPVRWDKPHSIFLAVSTTPEGTHTGCQRCSFPRQSMSFSLSVCSVVTISQDGSYIIIFYLRVQLPYPQRILPSVYPRKFFSVPAMTWHPA